jgi:hypothetical protein
MPGIDRRRLRNLEANRIDADQEALKAAAQWRFAPGTRMGEPVSVVTTLEFAFSQKK